jgi:hypothetical protein
LEARDRVMLGSFTGLGKTLVYAEMYTAAHPLFLLPDGGVHALHIPGVMTSGRYVTSSSNSRIRVKLAVLCGSLDAMANGDDCLEDANGDRKALQAKYRRYGRTVRDFEGVSAENGFEFTSHFYKLGQHFYPPDPSKSVYRLLNQKSINSEAIAGVLRYMRNMPNYLEWKAAIMDAIAFTNTPITTVLTPAVERDRSGTGTAGSASPESDC